MSVDVLHVVPAFFPTRGGIEVLLENLTPYLNSSSSLRHGILAPRVNNERPDTFFYENTPVFSVDRQHPDAHVGRFEGMDDLSREQAEFGRILLNTRAHLRATRPRLIHLHGLSFVGNAVSALVEKQGIPVVMHIHGSVGGALSRNMHAQLVDAVQVVAVSEFVRKSIASETGRINGVRVIRNGMRDPLSEQLQHLVPTPNPSVTLVGRLEPAKGFDVAIRALSSLINEFPSFLLNIVGVGEEQTFLESLVRQLNIERHVKFHGRLEHEDTLALIRSSWCVVVPSIAFEGFSLVALESAFLEVPVVAANVGGLPETVLDGVTGTIVNSTEEEDFAAATRMYLHDRSLAQVHGFNARKRAVSEYSLERMAGEVDQVHQTILGV